MSNEAGETEAKSKDELADHIGRLIEEEAVARALQATEARDAAVERIAEPVDH
jgi:hypothetical protein